MRGINARASDVRVKLALFLFWPVSYCLPPLLHSAVTTGPSSTLA